MKLDTRLSPHFLLREFLHGHTAGETVTGVPAPIFENLKLLAQNLEQARARLGGAAITVTSGYRTPRHNKKVGGAKNSYHLRGMAADIVVAGFTPREVQVILKDWPGGMGLAETFTHLDIRPYRARFEYGH